MAKQQSSDYSAQQIQVLEGLEPVRKRPGMYIGSTDLYGLHEALREIIDNSVDEALAGFAKNVWIFLNPDGSATVVDDGRGIPTDIHPVYKVSALELVMREVQRRCGTAVTKPAREEISPTPYFSSEDNFEDGNEGND